MFRPKVNIKAPVLKPRATFILIKNVNTFNTTKIAPTSQYLRLNTQIFKRNASSSSHLPSTPPEAANIHVKAHEEKAGGKLPETVVAQLSQQKDKNATIEHMGVTYTDTGTFIIRSDSPMYQGVREGTEPIDMISKVPPFEVAGRKVWCDGGSGPLGHPRIFINLDKKEPQSCGYCGLRYVQKPGHRSHDH